MFKQLVDEKHLEALTISNKSIVPILSYNEVDEINSAEQMQEVQSNAIRYFGNLGLIKTTKDRLVIDSYLSQLLESSKTNEQFFIFEHYNQAQLAKQWCFYPTENFVGVTKTPEKVEFTAAEKVEDVVSDLLSNFNNLKSFSRDVEINIAKAKYLEWMSAIGSQNVEQALGILLSLNVDEEIAEIITNIFIAKKDYFTLSFYVGEELKGKLMIMASQYPVVIHFVEEPELNLSILSASYADLYDFYKEFIIYPMTEMEVEVNG